MPLRAEKLLKIDRAAEMTVGLADQHQRLAGLFQARGHVLADIVDQADTADGRGRQNGLSIGFVVQ